MSLPSVNLLHLTEYKSLDKISKLMVNMTKSKVKSRSHHKVAHLHPLTNVPTKYQLPTPYNFRDIAWTRFYKSGSPQQGQRSNQDHTMTLHTYPPPPTPHPPTNVPTKYQLPTFYGFRDIAQTRFSNSRSLRQGQIKVRP